MKIGIIGIGSLTMEIAFRSARAGFKVIIYNHRGNSLVRDVAEKMGSNVTLGSLEQACDMDIIVLHIPKDDLEKVIDNMPDMSGKLILHTSGLIFDPHSLLSGIINALTYQITASLLPKAHVVKLFHPVSLQPKSTEHQNATKEQIFFIADHSKSGNSVKAFLKQLHFSPFDLSGKLHFQTGILHQKTMINPFQTNPFKNNFN